MILHFDYNSDTPLYMQIRNQIVLGIASEELAPGEQLPTIRALADETGINMMTVSKAYQLLKQEGYINTDRRGGTTVCSNINKEVSAESLSSLKLLVSELRLSGISKDELLQICEHYYEEAK